ncbi:MAG TPA: WG repeat-containing protein [Flavobacteriales bacterium]|nr:WG repeat-containing protein [Flavobacteriales bacterium]
MKTTVTLFFICLLLLPARTQNLYSFHNDEYKYGFKDSKGNIVVQPIYDYHDYVGNYLIKVRKDHTYYLLDSTGKEIGNYNLITDFEYTTDLLKTTDGQGVYARVEKNYKTGFIDKSGKEIFKPIYYGIGNFSEGLAATGSYNHGKGYIDKSGKLVIDTVLNYSGGVGAFSNGLAEVTIHAYLSDENGNILTDMAHIAGAIDKTGTEIVPVKYQPTQDYFKTGKELLYLVGAGNIETKNYYISINSTRSCKLSAFKGENGKYGFRGKKYVEKYGMYMVSDEIFIPARYDTVYQTYYDDLGNEIRYKGYSVVEISHLKGIVDSLGNEVVAPAYAQIGIFSETLAWVRSKKGGKFGYMDTKGKLMIDTTLNYVSVQNFSDGLAIVQGSGMVDELGNEHVFYGYLDKTGKEVIPLQYISAEDFKNGKAKVQLFVLDEMNVEHITEMYIDKKGNKLE